MIGEEIREMCFLIDNSERIRNILIYSGIDTIDKLKSMSEEDLYNIKGLGICSIQKILKYLESI